MRWPRRAAANSPGFPERERAIGFPPLGAGAGRAAGRAAPAGDGRGSRFPCRVRLKPTIIMTKPSTTRNIAAYQEPLSEPPESQPPESQPPESQLPESEPLHPQSPESESDDPELQSPESQLSPNQPPPSPLPPPSEGPMSGEPIEQTPQMMIRAPTTSRSQPSVTEGLPGVIGLSGFPWGRAPQLSPYFR